MQSAAIASAALILLLASIGLYGVVALAVAQRRREIGIRMALGAHARQVAALFYASGVKVGVLGLALGLPFMHVLNRRTNGSTGAQHPDVWLVGGIVAAVVLVVASIATLVPAARAASVNPVTALRGD